MMSSAPKRYFSFNNFAACQTSNPTHWDLPVKERPSQIASEVITGNHETAKHQDQSRIKISYKCKEGGSSRSNGEIPNNPSGSTRPFHSGKTDQCPSFFGSESEQCCSILLRENYALIKQISVLKDAKDRLLNQIKDLVEKNEDLEAALSGAVEERNRLLSTWPSPRLYCNFSVTKMYEEWVRGLKEELHARKNQLQDTQNLLMNSCRNEKELANQMTRMEDSLIFYRQIAQEMADCQPGEINVPTDFDALYEKGFAMGFAVGSGEGTADRAKYASLLEENAMLHDRLRESEMECFKKSQELEDLKLQLSKEAADVMTLRVEQNSLMARCAACIEELMNVRSFLETERDRTNNSIR